MAIGVGNHSFEGPYTNTSALQNRPGVYAIHCYFNNAYYLMDIGESSNVKERVENHDRKDCWNRNCKGTLTVSVLYTLSSTEEGRRIIEKEIRNQYNPPCGIV